MPTPLFACRLLLLPTLLLLAACAGVRVSALDTQDYMAQRRGDVLTTGRLSASVGSPCRSPASSGCLRGSAALVP